VVELARTKLGVAISRGSTQRHRTWMVKHEVKVSTSPPVPVTLKDKQAVKIELTKIVREALQSVMADIELNGSTPEKQQLKLSYVTKLVDVQRYELERQEDETVIDYQAFVAEINRLPPPEDTAKLGEVVAEKNDQVQILTKKGRVWFKRMEVAGAQVPEVGRVA